MKSKTTPIIIAVLIPLISVAVALSLVFFKKRGISEENEFRFDEYSDSPKSLVGNKYLIKAELEMQLAKVDNGRIVSLTDSNGDKFAIFIPDSLNVNARTKQRYNFDVRIGSKGEIIAESMCKH